MGNTLTIYPYSISDPRTISFSQLQKIEDLSYRKVWRSRFTGEEYEEYTIRCRSNRTMEEEMAKYERRRQQELGLVAVRYVENIISIQSLTESCKQFKVFTERIPLTLADVSSMPLTSALLLLERVFVAFNILFKQVGFFDVMENMIGFDTKSLPKVWLSSCWANNDPLSSATQSGNLTHLEGIMVKKIFEIIEMHIKEEEIGNYMYEKNKIQQWTFELASAFVNYFIKSQRIVLPKSVVCSKKPSTLEALIKSNYRREFSLKDPNYTLNITVPQPLSSIPTIPSSRQNPNKFMFDSTQFNSGTQLNQSMKPKPSFILPSPKSNIGHSFSGITGLDFKQSTIKTRREKDQSVMKSTCPKKRNSQIFGFDFNQKKNRLQDHLANLTVQRDASETGFNLESRSKGRSKGKSFNIKQDQTLSETSEKKKESMMEKRMETQTQSIVSQSAISKEDALKFKEGSKKDDKSSNERSSGMEKSKFLSLDFNLIPDNTFYTSTTESNGFYTPMTKPKSYLFKNPIEHRVGTLFSQEIKQKFTFQEVLSLTPNTPCPLLHKHGKQIQHSQIIAESNEEISEFQEKCEEARKAKTFLSQSITLEELMVEAPKKVPTTVSMLDELIMKKTIERMEGDVKYDDVDMLNPNILARSIIETGVEL